MFNKDQGRLLRGALEAGHSITRAFTSVSDLFTALYDGALYDPVRPRELAIPYDPVVNEIIVHVFPGER